MYCVLREDIALNWTASDSASLSSGGAEEEEVAEEHDQKWQEVRDGAAIGPFEEGERVALRCSAGGGRPIPEVREKERD